MIASQAAYSLNSILVILISSDVCAWITRTANLRSNGVLAFRWPANRAPRAYLIAYTLLWIMLSIIMEVSSSNLSHQIADRVRQLRGEQGLSLDALASKSGVSRSMISLIERGEASPTAVVLDKLAAGLGVTLPALFDAAASATANRGPVARRDEQPQWRDPDSGYVRRNVSPPGMRQPMHIVEVLFPPGERVTFETGARNMNVYQQVWVLEGAIDITLGPERYQLRQGDCMAMQLDRPIRFHNPTRRTTRYALVITSEPYARR